MTLLFVLILVVSGAGALGALLALNSTEKGGEDYVLLSIFALTFILAAYHADKFFKDYTLCFPTT